MQNPPSTSQRYCGKCGASININAAFCGSCRTPLSLQPQIPVMDRTKSVSETQCTCRACGKVWFYGKQEALQNVSNATANLGKSMMCCGGCLPALLIPDKKTVNLKKCPN